MPNVGIFYHQSTKTSQHPTCQLLKKIQLGYSSILPLESYCSNFQNQNINFLFIFPKISSYLSLPTLFFLFPLLRILLSLLPLCLIALSLVKDRFWCGYILAWAPAWVRWWCGSWVWRHGGSQRGGSWRGGSQTHGRGEWVLMGGFRRGLGWIPTLMVFGCWFFAMDFCFLDFGFRWGLGLA